LLTTPASSEASADWTLCEVCGECELDDEEDCPNTLTGKRKAITKTKVEPHRNFIPICYPV
jgi:hypothetical protein